MERIQNIWSITQGILEAQRPPTVNELSQIHVFVNELLSEQPVQATLIQSRSQVENQWLDRFFNLLALHHHDADLSLPQISRALAMSRASLNRKVKTLTGTSVMDHLRRIRLEFAAAKLVEGDTPVYAIAYECGFTDPNYFCRAFSKGYRQSPTQYRQSVLSLRQKSRILRQ